MRVLVVDDEPSLLRATVKMLARAGTEVRGAGDVDSAILELGWADVLLVDWSMPTGNGGLTPLGLAAAATCLVVFHTASPWIVEGYPVIPKPTKAEEILRILGELLSERATLPRE